MTPDPAIADMKTREQAGGASARTARYVGRLDPHLESLPSNAARVAFLSKELVNWTALYNQFLLLIDKGFDPDPDGPDVYDYLQTICEISVRQARYGKLANDSDVRVAGCLVALAFAAATLVNALVIAGVLA